MNLRIDENSTNYFCTVIKIDNLHPIEGADKIQRTVIFGNSIVCSKEIKIGDIFLYFVAGTRLNADYCYYNNLYDSSELNSDTSVRGYISSKRRVKAIKLRGIVSDGMLMPLDSLDAFHLDIKHNLKVGDQFTHIDDVMICEKYESPVNQNVNERAPKDKKQIKLKDLIVDKQFHFHFETEHFARNLNKIKDGDRLVITRKYHGSSFIVSNVLINKTLKWYEKFALKLGINIETKEYGYVYSSGKPKSRIPKGVESDSLSWGTSNQHFYTENIWKRALTELKPSLEKGISIYGEIIGKGIQGDNYTYGFDYALKVYRITQTNVDGIVYEFTWDQIKKYCNKYGLTYVDEYEIISAWNDHDGTDEWCLNAWQTDYLNKSYPDCKIDEGICVRNDTTGEIFKLKSPNFVKQETDLDEAGVENVES